MKKLCDTIYYVYCSANGYGRSEGTIVFYLQRAEDAKRNYGSVKLCDTYYYGLNPSTVLGCDEYYFKSSLEKIHQRYSDSEKYISDVAYVEMNAYGCQVKLCVMYMSFHFKESILWHWLCLKTFQIIYVYCEIIIILLFSFWNRD